MTDPASPSPASAQAAVESACVEALVSANLLAVGVVRDGMLRHASPALVRAFGLGQDAMPMPFTEFSAFGFHLPLRVHDAHPLRGFLALDQLCDPRKLVVVFYIAG